MAPTPNKQDIAEQKAEQVKQKPADADEQPAPLPTEPERM